MKLWLSALLFSFYCTYCFGQQLPNSSFENWSLRGEYIEPDGWISTNAFAFNGAVETCYPFEDAHTGKWAMKLESRIDPLTKDTLQAILVLGSDYTYPGIHYNQRPTGLKFFYKHNLKDTALAAIFLTKWNTQTNRRDTIASAFHFFTDSTSTYKALNIPLNYTQSIRPDSCITIFLSTLKSKPNPHNFLLIDDLELTGNVNVGSEEWTSLTELKVYPNPVTDILKIDAEQSIQSVIVFDAQGKQILKVNDNKVDVNSFYTGTYYLLIEFEKGKTYTTKFYKQ